MKNMNTIMENWRRFLEQEQPTSAKPSGINTFGDLKNLISNVITKQRKDAAKSGAVNIAIDQILGIIPGASNAKSAFDFFKGIYNATDDKKTNTVLDKLNVDDEYSKIVDDKVEMAFLKTLSDTIMKKPDNEIIPQDYDINLELENYLKSKHKNRTLSR